MTALGILNCFNKLYGPDLINTAKASVLFYEKIFNDCGVNPTEVMVIDDSAEKLFLAAELGATTIHVKNFKRCPIGQCLHHINQVNELPKLLAKD